MNVVIWALDNAKQAIEEDLCWVKDLTEQERAELEAVIADIERAKAHYLSVFKVGREA